MRLRLVVFDVDGTLIDSQAHICAAMAQAFGGLGLPMPAREAVLGIVGLSLPQAMVRLAPELAARDHDALVEAYKAAFTGLRAEALSPLYPGALAALDALAQDAGLLLGIATGKSRRGLAHILAAHDLGRRFVTTQVADDHPSKPHPAMLHACLRETGVAASDAVMVGDTSYDMDMARAAEVHALGVGWGYHAPGLLGPRVIADFAHLPEALEAIWSGART